MYTYTFVAKYTRMLESTVKHTADMLLHLTLKPLLVLSLY